MSDPDLDARLADMAARRRDAQHAQARRDAVMLLLERDGAVDEDAINRHMADTWTEPPRAGMAAQVAAKAHAAVEHTAAQLEVLKGCAVNAHATAEQAQTNADRAVAAVSEAEAAVDAARAAHEAAVAVAAHADGDPYQAPPPTSTDATAAAATVTEGA